MLIVLVCCQLQIKPVVMKSCLQYVLYYADTSHVLVMSMISIKVMTGIVLMRHHCDISDFHNYARIKDITRIDKSHFTESAADVSHHEYLGSDQCYRSEMETGLVGHGSWVMGHPFGVLRAGRAGLWVRGVTRQFLQALSSICEDLAYIRIKKV